MLSSCSSPVLSCVNELLNGAFANISLHADRVWSCDDTDCYRKLNEALLLQTIELDRILQDPSNFKFNEKNNSDFAEVSEDVSKEPWMLDEVEEQFIRLTKSCSNYTSKFPDRECESDYYGFSPVKESKIKKRFSYEETDASNEENLRQKIQSDSLRMIWDQSLETVNNLISETKNPFSNSDCASNCKSPSKLASKDYSRTQQALHAEVPEFFPKSPAEGTKDHAQMQYNFATKTSSYRTEVYSYRHLQTSTPIITNPNIPVLIPTTVNTMFQLPHHWVQRVTPLQIRLPVCTPVPICSSLPPLCHTLVRPVLHTKILATSMTNPAPVSVRPPDLYQDYQMRRKNQGVDFSNLILLTKSAMKMRRSQPKNPQQSASFILESRQPNLKSESDVIQWLNRGYPKRAREFEQVNNLATKLEDFGTKCEEEAMDDEGLDKSFDELERQAIEQYRRSDESISVQFQELERQAEEQYKSEENEFDFELKSWDELSDLETECPGFGQCSPRKKRKRNEDFSSSSKSQTASEEKVLAVSDVENDDGKRLQPAVVTRSLTALTDDSPEARKKLKSPADKIDKAVKSSLKRRLIFMSSLKRDQATRMVKSEVDTRWDSKFIEQKWSLYRKSKPGAEGDKGDTNIKLRDDFDIS